MGYFVLFRAFVRALHHLISKSPVGPRDSFQLTGRTSAIRWVPDTPTSPFLPHQPCLLAVPVAVFPGLALVVEFFAFSETDLQARHQRPPSTIVFAFPGGAPTPLTTTMGKFFLTVHGTRKLELV